MNTKQFRQPANGHNRIARVTAVSSAAVAFGSCRRSGSRRFVWIASNNLLAQAKQKGR